MASIVSSVAKELGSLAAEEVKSLYQVKDKIESLKDTLIYMGMFLEDADNQRHQQEGARMWVSQIRDFAYEAQDIVDKYLYQVSYHRQDGKWNTVKWLLCCLCDAKVLHDLDDQIKYLRRRISGLTENLRLCGVRMSNQLESSAYNSDMMEQRRTYSHTNENPIGLEKHIEYVVDYLVNKNEAGVVGICGIGGLGKTTLTRQVFNNEVVKKHFENNCVWVYISKQFKRKKIFKDILLGLSNSTQDENKRSRVQELTEDELPGEIKKVLKDKKCLVVLDDMWKARDWNALKPAFELINESSSKVLITTRTRSLVEHAHGHSYSVDTLSKEDSWRLLQRILSLEEERSGQKETTSSLGTPNMKQKSREEGQAGLSPTFGRDQIDQTKLQDNEVEIKKKLAKEMVKHCNGLPLAITTLGGILLSKKIISEWKAVQKNISNHLMNHREEESGSQGLLVALELSYNDLPYYLKPCFLYMGMYPEDHEIEVEELFHLWEAEGLVTSSLDGGGELHDVLLDDIAEMYLNQLVERSMVQVEKTWPNGRIKSCRLHDIMRDMCLKKCREGNFMNIIEQESSTDSSSLTARACLLNRRMRCCVVHDSGHLDPLLDLELSNNGTCIRSLIVFAPTGSGERKLVSKNKRKFLSQLRVLYISDSEYTSDFKVESVLRDSIHLRFLKVSGFIDCTPLRPRKCFDFSACFWEWKYLETLDLSDCEMDYCCSKFCMKLERLRHLYLPQEGLTFKDSGKLSLSTNQLRQIETLKNFDVERCEIEDLKQMNNLRNFSLLSYFTPIDGEALKVLLKSPVITRKPLVEPLNLRIDAKMINEDPSILIKSEAIYIKNLLVDGRIDGSVVDAEALFPHSLEEVTLEDCEISNGVITGLGKLPRLNHLMLIRNAVEGNSMSFSDGSFPCLESLKLDRMENLKEWEVGEGTCPSLEEVRLTAYEISTGVITVLGKLPRLKLLAIKRNAIEGNRMSFSDGSFPCLEHLELGGMENLEEWEVGEGTCPSLRQLDVWGCRKLKLIPKGLPNSLVVCCDPCVKGCEKYGGCRA